MIKSNYYFLTPLSLSLLFLAGFLFQNFYDETIAQLDIPEAKPIGASETGTANTTGFIAFDDLGYTIKYPENWESVAPNFQYGLAAFRSPDGSTVAIKFIPKDDADVDSIEELIEQFQEVRKQNTFTRNSTTTLDSLPAFIEEGVYTFRPNVFESIAGEQGYTSRIYDVWGYSEDKDGFYGVLFDAASKAQYDDTLPVAKRIIDSFTVDEREPLIPDTKEDTDSKEAGDTFVGSAGTNDEDKKRQDND
jgi:hypothetical protein